MSRSVPPASLIVLLLAACQDPEQADPPPPAGPAPCAASHSACGALCVELASDAAHCGACGRACDAGQPCVEGQCGGGRLALLFLSDIRTLQPILVADVPSGTVTGRLYEPLIRADVQTGAPIPALATWSASADGLTYDLEIRAGANWSDGRPILAEDWLTTVKAVARSKKTIRKPNFREIEGFDAYAAGATSISGIQANGKNLRVKLVRSFCPALFGLFAFAPLPTHVFGRYTEDADTNANLDAASENLAPPVSSGPFVFKERVVGDRVVLARNPHYWKGAPRLDELVYEVLDASSEVPPRLASGSPAFGNVEPSQLAALEANPALRVVKWQALGYTYLGWNLRSATAPVLANKLVRHALARGLNMSTVMESVLLGQGTRMVSHHPPASWAYPSGLEQYPYDKAAAESLIQQAGYTKNTDGFYTQDGATLGFSLVTNAGNALRAALMQTAVTQYADIGVKVVSSAIPFQTLVTKLTEGNSDIEAWILGWSLGADPDPHGIWHSSQIPDRGLGRTGFNIGGFTSGALDQAIDAGRTGDCSVAARKVHYDTFNRILNEGQPYNFGFSQLTLTVVPARLQEFAGGTFDGYANIEKWWLRKE